MDRREVLRDTFKEFGFTYSDIKTKEIHSLIEILEDELSSFQNNSFRMKLRMLREKDIQVNPDKSIIKMFLTVDGALDGQTPYFKRREAISFNQGGFIGFAGWADSKNVQPFLNAFSKWITILEKKQSI